MDIDVSSFDCDHLNGEPATHPRAWLARRLAVLRTPSVESALRASLRLSQSAPGGLVLLVAGDGPTASSRLASQRASRTLGRVKLRFLG